jgi:hypothetical protein
MRFRWLRNGVDIERPHDPGSTLRLPLFTLADQGYYEAEVSNSFGVVRSRAVTVLGEEPPSITQQPCSIDVTLVRYDFSMYFIKIKLINGMILNCRATQLFFQSRLLELHL